MSALSPQNPPHSPLQISVSDVLASDSAGGSLPQSTLLLMLASAGFLVVYGVLLYITAFAASPFVLFFAGMFLLYPFRTESTIVRRLMALMTITFLFWLVRELAALFVPFIVAFALAYMVEPSVRFLERKKIARWLSALVFVVMLVGAGLSVAIFIFPLVFAQLNDIIRELSTLITTASDYLESRQFFRLLSSYGLNSPETRDLIKKELIPRLEGSLGAAFKLMLSFLNSISSVVSQLLNIILTPILTFYFLVDFEKLKNALKSALSGKNEKFLHDLRRINYIVRAYITGQAIAALVTGVAASVLFALFGLPYPVVLGAICGLLNPIPYVGMAVSMVIGFITVVVVGSGEGILGWLAVIVGVVGGLHFLDTYFIQPRLVGTRVGIRPLALISSLFIFGHFFGLAGLLFAVPAMASLLMFGNDWLQKKKAEDAEEASREAANETANEAANETANEQSPPHSFTPQPSADALSATS
jgi:predicted PurR-regulated permease PerM